MKMGPSKVAYMYANKFERVRFEKEIWLADSPPLVIGCKKCVGIKNPHSRPVCDA